MQHLDNELPADPHDTRILRLLIIILLVAPIVIIVLLGLAISISGPNY